MHAHQQAGDESGAEAKAPKNTAATFYRVNRESSPERTARVAALHERFVLRKKLRAAWDAQEARDLRAAYELKLWEECGCASLCEYLERFCGFTRREAVERFRVAMALADLPRLEDELEASRLPYSSVRELVRVVVAEKQDEWVTHCAEMNSDQVARAVSGHKRGDSPDDPVDPDEHRHRVVFELRDYTRARFKAAMRGLTRMRGHQFVDDDDQFQTITDILEWYVSSASTKASAPIAQNENVATFTQTLPPSSEQASQASPDGPIHSASSEESTLSGPPDEQTHPASSFDQSSPGAVTARPPLSPPTVAHSPGCGCGETKLDGPTVAAMRKALSRPPVHVWLCPDGTGYAHGVQLPPDELATLLCDSVDMGNIDDPKAKARKHLSNRERARTLALWGNQCAVPGCCADVDIDIHHIEALEDGGQDIDRNRLPLCRPHHRLRHAGKLLITGVAPYSVQFSFVTPTVVNDN